MAIEVSCFHLLIIVALGNHTYRSSLNMPSFVVSHSIRK